MANITQSGQCTNSHRTTTVSQGPGACCRALAQSGQAAAVGVRVAATNKAGKCFVCEVVQSTSSRHPGKLVFRKGKSMVPGSNVSCPTAQEGCCALAAA